MAQLVKHLTLDPKVLSSNPTLGVEPLKKKNKEVRIMAKSYLTRKITCSVLFWKKDVFIQQRATFKGPPSGGLLG